MTGDLYSSTYNPDVLSCLANLSNDEVFTPPALVNQMLDLLPKSLWNDPSATFLDPACKSGVFLREIAKRLLEGLNEQIPDLQTRIDHIFQKQVYGIAITELTSLLSRRSLYCSKYPNSRYSITPFEEPAGNVQFRRINHSWKKGRCVFCGAAQKELDRGPNMESHAYEFIHTVHPEELVEMKFDVIIGNPPYQLNTSGSVESQATPLYNKFILQAIKLNPKYLIMITPSRWLNGGFGLDQFRNTLLSDNRVRVIHDYLNSKDCFNGVEIKGGVCYFLWSRDDPGLCSVFTHKGESIIVESERPLLEKGIDTFIRHTEAISILKKVQKFQEGKFLDLVSPRDPFGLNYYQNGSEVMFKLFSKSPGQDRLAIYSQGWLKNGVSYVERKFITTRLDLVDRYKVFISKAYGAGESYPHQILNRPFVGEPGTCSNMTYLVIGGYDNLFEAENVISYIQTRFFRFLVSLLKNTQNAYKKVYSFVPIQDFTKPWTDEELYAKYGLNEEEIAFIESMIRPMDLNNKETDD